MSTYKISIPEPCSENWNKMTPTDTGRFCQQCTKNVIDFTGMTNEEISLYLMQHKEERVCGRFKQQQLSSITIQIPQKVLLSQTQFRKMFLLALLFSMGTTLLSCSDKAGNKQKIENVVIEEDEVIASEDTIKNTSKTPSMDPDNIIVGDVPRNMENAAALPIPPPTQEGEFMEGMVVYEPDSVPKCETIKQRPLHTIGKVALDFEPKKEENNHIQGDTIITPPQ